VDTLDKKQEIRLLHITDGGSQIVLEDESRWKVAPYFKIEVFENWTSGDRVTVGAVSDDPNYPCTIFNTDEGFEVAAKRIN
jgi:hypothetical protein